MDLDRFKQLALRWNQQADAYATREQETGSTAESISLNAAAAWHRQLAKELAAEIRAAEIQQQMEVVA